MEQKQYIFKHKNTPIAVINFANQKDIVYVNYISASSVQYLPVGCSTSVHSINRWWQKRKAVKQQDILCNLGLSMTDCYWVCPIYSSLSWEQVSLYRNNFVDNGNDLMLCIPTAAQTIGYEYTPHSTTKGEMLKKWFCLPKMQRVLVKGSHNDNYLQCVNECFATELHKRQQKVTYTEYSLCNIQTSQGAAKGCVCNSFCNERLELCTYWDLLQCKKQVEEDAFEFIVKTLSNVVNRKYVEFWFSYLFLTDFILSNSDRHMENIGFYRDADTLQLLGFAPIFDTGNCMFWNMEKVPQGKELLQLRINSLCNVETNMFQFVCNFYAVDLHLLPTEQDIRAFYGSLLSAERVEQMINAYNYKVNVVRQIQQCGSAKQVLAQLKQ